MLVDIKIHLKSVYDAEPPKITLKVDEYLIHDGALHNDEIFEYSSDIKGGEHNLTLELLNKQDSDCIDGGDKAVIVDKITFFDIDSKHVLYNSTYIPNYSEAYQKSSTEAGEQLNEVLTSCNYLGWNGTWSILFTVPVFTWLHKIENLGWLYPKN